ncbi:hypothetical protein JOC75_000273 [Metabacillus crassostreae]|uniref:YndM family protein n=1 Tax=Metabacillus crassostreae TaxID=929098 RepID=UPI00195E1324|nr:YndM family protein [Metabacillus crassostreae]MBM7602303.1 hypothetical protein [Metabacillus crassostreae]
MNIFKAFLIKIIAIFAVSLLILGVVFNYSFEHVLAISIILSFTSFVLGDLLLLPRTSNITATISDFALAMLVTWFYLANLTLYVTNVFFASVLTSISVAVFESFFHRYLKRRNVQDEEKRQRDIPLRYQTETSEEITPNKSRMDRIRKQK